MGFALLVAHLVAGPIDGTSVNPARRIGPALLHGRAALSQLWLFILAPLIGAVLAVTAHTALALRAADDGKPSVRPADARLVKNAPATTAAATTEPVDHRPPGAGQASRKQRNKERRKRR